MNHHLLFSRMFMSQKKKKKKKKNFSFHMCSDIVKARRRENQFGEMFINPL